MSYALVFLAGTVSGAIGIVYFMYWWGSDAPPLEQFIRRETPDE